MGNKKDSAISRREFARRAALFSARVSLATPSLLGTEVLASTSVAQQPPNPPKLSPESQSEAESRLQAILSEYRIRFSDAQQADLRRLCTEAQPVLDRLRAYPTENGDDPALYLKPLMEREKKPSPMIATPKPATTPKKP
jgi:hypothetical protein